MSDNQYPLKVAFLWHQHQPYYKDFESGRFILPWVRLHGVKDYLDMVKILDDFPAVKQTFNLVPSLLEQIADYISNDAVDNHLALTSKKATDLTDLEKTEIVSTFFSANIGTMIKPYPRFYQLHEKVMLNKSDLSKAAQTMTDQEFIDLAIWSNLVWIDPSFRSDPDISHLFGKKRDFEEEDKEDIIRFQKKILAGIIPAHRDAQDRGQIEVSFSPYFHPILPLLIDTDLAREALPHIQLPGERFSHPEDAHRQIELSCDMYRQLFGRELTGMWPSEGSVAEPLIPILIEHGIKWIATDDEILHATINHPESAKRGLKLPEDATYHRPFMLKRREGKVGIIFRNHILSDKIGFVYSGWDPERAAKDFVSTLHEIRRQLPKESIDHCVVPVILDGENAWEYYKNDGVDFLKELYRRLSEDDTIETVTVSEVFAGIDEVQELPYLFAGSWINHDFRVWIGHAEDNKAWDLLSAARNALVEFQNGNPDADPVALESAWKEIYIAEGSDWCWWYGDEHSSLQDDVFDKLYRSHLSAVYRLIGQEPPSELMQPIRGIRGVRGIEQPIGLVSPKVDGLVTDFYEWHDAGIFDCMKAGSAMHRAINVVHAIYWGFDDRNISFRLDLFTQAEDDAAAEYGFKIILRAGNDYLIEISESGVSMHSKEPDGESYSEMPFGGKMAMKKIVELSIPRGDISFDDLFSAHIQVEVTRKGEQVERWPSYDMIHTTMPTEDKSAFWQV
jgi:alpha-amylase/alpha-mannosidase (GH57 family)